MTPLWLMLDVVAINRLIVNIGYLAVMNQYILINNIIDRWHEARGMRIVDDELFLC